MKLGRVLDIKLKKYTDNYIVEQPLGCGAASCFYAVGTFEKFLVSLQVAPNVDKCACAQMRR